MSQINIAFPMLKDFPKYFKLRTVNTQLIKANKRYNKSNLIVII